MGAATRAAAIAAVHHFAIIFPEPLAFTDAASAKTSLG